MSCGDTTTRYGIAPEPWHSPHSTLASALAASTGHAAGFKLQDRCERRMIGRRAFDSFARE
jgi:hypothetical protein